MAKLTVEIDADNAAFDEVDEVATETGRILRALAAQIEDGNMLDFTTLHDLNGNTVGSAAWKSAR